MNTHVQQRSHRLIRATALLLILTWIPYCLGQTDGANHRKYWYYRSRLVNDFVKIGLGNGESMPFNQRGHCGDSGCRELYLGDGVSTLGYYIALLAIEYSLLASNQQDTKKVVNELFCALNAANRLDFRAEGYYQFGAERLNGFFVRDDIPSDFITNNSGHFNYNGSVYQGFISQMPHAAEIVHSDWSGGMAASPKTDIAMSQDQVYNLLFGLAFVNKFLPLTVTNGNAQFPYTGQASLTQESRNIASRVINFIRKPTDIGGAPCGNPGNTFPNLWRIRNPTTCNLVEAGDDASAFAYPLAEINCQLNTQSTAPLTTFDAVPHSCSLLFSGYYDLYAASAGYVVWNSGIKTAVTWPGDPGKGMDTRVFFENLAAIANCSYDTVAGQYVTALVSALEAVPLLNWLGIVINWTYNLVSHYVTTFVPGYKVNSTQIDILVNAYISGSPLDHAPLARAVLHGGWYQHNPNYGFKYLLDIAPCDKIYNFATSNQSTYEWSSDSRLDHPNRRGQDPVADKVPSGEYNAIDYMLYHNLWYVYLGGNQQITDLSDIHIRQPSYVNGNIDAYETVDFVNTAISVPTPTYIRAGKTISFGPGTQIVSGSNLHAYIEGYHCATDTGHY